MNKFQPNRKDLFRLYDRVLLVRSAIGRGIPAGRYGTVVAEHYTAFTHILDVNNDSDNPTEVDVLFDEGGENVSNFKDNILRIHISYLLKIESTIIRRGGSGNKGGQYQNRESNKYQDNRYNNSQDNRYQNQNNRHQNNQDSYNSPRDAFSPRNGNNRRNRNDSHSRTQNQQERKDQYQEQPKDTQKPKKQQVKLMQKSGAKKTNEHLENELKKMLNVSQPVNVNAGSNSNAQRQTRQTQQNNPQQNRQHQHQRSPNGPNQNIQLNTTYLSAQQAQQQQAQAQQQSPSVLAQLFPNQQPNFSQSSNSMQNSAFDLQSFSQQMVRPPLTNANQISNNAVNQLFNQNNNQQMFSPRQGQNFPQQAPQAQFVQNSSQFDANMPMSHVRQPVGPPGLPENHPSNQSFGFAKMQQNDEKSRVNHNGFRGSQSRQNHGHNQAGQSRAENHGGFQHNGNNQNPQNNQYQQLISNMQEPMQQQQQNNQQPQFANPAIDNLFNMQNNPQKGGKKFAPNFSATTPRSGRKGGRK
jgi:hypothetical protein